MLCGQIGGLLLDFLVNEILGRSWGAKALGGEICHAIYAFAARHFLIFVLVTVKLRLSLSRILIVGIDGILRGLEALRTHPILLKLPIATMTVQEISRGCAEQQMIIAVGISIYLHWLIWFLGL